MKTPLLFSYVLAMMAALSAQAAGEPIRIGYIGGLTGPDVAQAAKFSVEGIQMVFEEVNLRGGIKGRKLELVPIDNLGVPQENLAAFEKAKAAGVRLITGVHYSNDGLLLAELAEKARIPLLITTATHPDIVKDRKFVARMCFNDESQSDTLSAFTVSSLKPKKVIVITDVRNSFSLYISKRYIQNLSKTPSITVTELKVSKGDTVFDETINAVMSGTQPDLVFFTTQARESATLITELRKRGLKAKFLGTDAWAQVDIIKILKALGQTEPIYFTSHGLPDFKSRLWKKLSERVLRNHQQQLSPYLCDPTLSVDAALQIVAALSSAKSFSPEDIMAAIKASKVNGIMGSSSFLSSGESRKRAKLFSVKNDSVEPVSLESGRP